MSTRVTHLELILRHLLVTDKEKSVEKKQA